MPIVNRIFSLYFNLHFYFLRKNFNLNLGLKQEMSRCTLADYVCLLA